MSLIIACEMAKANSKILIMQIGQFKDFRLIDYSHYYLVKLST